jgi:SM-20-related protein
MRLVDLNPALDTAGAVPALAAAFARDRRLQIRDVLTDESARIVHQILAAETPWGLRWRAGAHGPESLRAETLNAQPEATHRARAQAVAASMRGAEYAFSYASYPMVEAYKAWDPDGPHDMLIEYMNDRPVMDFIRAVTGIPELVKADAQATLYAPGHFLAVHDDRQESAGRRVAYVLMMCAVDWRPDWGGYLAFYDDAGDVVSAFRPRFNALNLFAVPQKHAVTFVAPFAPVERYAITGWFMDR